MRRHAGGRAQNAFYLRVHRSSELKPRSLSTALKSFFILIGIVAAVVEKIKRAVELRLCGDAPGVPLSLGQVLSERLSTKDAKAGLAPRLFIIRQERNILMKYHIYKDIGGEWRWSLEAAKGRKIANSGEGYKNKGDCAAAIDLVKGSSIATVHKK